MLGIPSHPPELVQFATELVALLERSHRSDGTLKTSAVGTVRQTILSGATAGHHVVDGVRVGDALIGVTQVTGGVPVDLTSEFSITAPNRITNTSGTDTTGDVLVVLWRDLTD